MKKEFNPIKAMNDIIEAMADKALKDESKEVKEGGEGFTGGEWEADTSHNMDMEGIQIWAEDLLIANILPDQHNQHKANAALLAQSKNMYYALKDIIGVLDPLSHNPVHSSLMDKAIDILKKANPNY